MARSGTFRNIRRHRRVLAIGLAYAFLLSALLGVGLSVQAVAAALGPIAAAATCATEASGPAGSGPVHKAPHLPDCALCGLACPMHGALALPAGGPLAAVVAPDFARGIEIAAGRATGPRAPGNRLSDAPAQAPPAIG